MTPVAVLSSFISKTIFEFSEAVKVPPGIELNVFSEISITASSEDVMTNPPTELFEPIRLIIVSEF